MRYTLCVTKSIWTCQCTSSRINKVEGLHQNQLFLVKRIDPEQDRQIAARLFEVASTQIGCEVPHEKIYEASTPPIEVQAQAATLLDIDTPDVQVLKLQKLIISAYRALRTIFAGWWFEKE